MCYHQLAFCVGSCLTEFVRYPTKLVACLRRK
jgi:hypothetical protein